MAWSLREKVRGVNGSERERELGGCPGVCEARADAWAQVGYVASKFCEFDTHPSCQIRKLRV